MELLDQEIPRIVPRSPSLFDPSFLVDFWCPSYVSDVQDFSEPGPTNIESPGRNLQRSGR